MEPLKASVNNTQEDHDDPSTRRILSCVPLHRDADALLVALLRTKNPNIERQLAAAVHFQEIEGSFQWAPIFSGIVGT